MLVGVSHAINPGKGRMSIIQIGDETWELIGTQGGQWPVPTESALRSKLGVAMSVCISTFNS